jgi:hypothetical protein
VWCVAVGKVHGMKFVDRIAQRASALRLAVDRGMSTAEYAVGTVAACGFAALLYKILTSDTVLHLVTDIIDRALHIGL